MAEAPNAYPLAWPSGWQRTEAVRRKTPHFRTMGEKNAEGWRSSNNVTLVDARERLQNELDKLGATATVLSTNLELRIDGSPRADRGEPMDSGVAVYFRLKGLATVLACDRWNRVAGNVAAIAAHIQAMRDQERWGVGTAAQAFAGYARLPSAMVTDDWREPLEEPQDIASAEATYKAKMLRAHPDRGGSARAAAVLNAAIAAARKHFA